jgi:hypothetical protein
MWAISCCGRVRTAASSGDPPGYSGRVRRARILDRGVVIIRLSSSEARRLRTGRLPMRASRRALGTQSYVNLLLLFLSTPTERVARYCLTTAFRHPSSASPQADNPPSAKGYGEQDLRASWRPLGCL